MKERLKKFWHEEKERLYFYGTGFGAGVASCLVFYLDAKGKQVKHVALRVNEEEGRAIVDLEHRNGFESHLGFHRPPET